MPSHSSDSHNERLSRTAAFYGPDGFSKIRLASVTVVGVGGVGSHAAIALARSGVFNLHLIDPDKVTPSSLNRFVPAGPADVGRAKVDVLAFHLTATCPHTNVLASEVLVNEQNVAAMLKSESSVVVDAIDSLEEKVALLSYCVRNDIPVVSSMGAAVRREVGAVRVADLFDNQAVAKTVDHVLYVPPCHELMLPILEIVPLQLLAYHVAVRLGCDVDQPRNLAKSVTVE